MVILRITLSFSKFQKNIRLFQAIFAWIFAFWDLWRHHSSLCDHPWRSVCSQRQKFVHKLHKIVTLASWLKCVSLFVPVVPSGGNGPLLFTWQKFKTWAPNREHDVLVKKLRNFFKSNVVKLYYTNFKKNFEMKLNCWIKRFSYIICKEYQSQSE